LPNKKVIRQDITPEIINERYNIFMTKEIGIEYTEIGSDYICGKMPVNEKTMQPFGILHGAASVVLAESLGSIGSNMMIDLEKEYCVGQAIDANHIRPMTSGFVFGKAICIHKGKKTHIWEIKITNNEGKLICASRLTVAVLER
jgi:1,4-dihydroxy-2-naphthoyl-CoA hydrolase